MTESDTSLCSICRRPKKADGKGTLTQWIVVCTCDFDATSSSQSTAERLSLCQACGKRIANNRAGSLTQWVLRSDSCKCEFPRAITDGIDAAIAREQELLNHPQTAEEDSLNEEEIEVPIGSFPLDRYKPLSEIGTGALGVVYLCRDRLLSKRVAIKCLRSVSPEQLVSFQMEAKATSQLKHPGVVSVLDFGSIDGGAPYMVLEYIDGFTLEQTLSEDGPVSMEAVVSLFSQAADALSYAHNKGIFHRDLKSSNIMIVVGNDHNFDVKIIDFGIATFKHATLEPTILQGNSIVGTPAYMSPDQALGLTYDARSEIYSLGCVMFEALTGRPPFVGNTALETINMHAHQPPPKLSECGGDFTFPDAMENLIAKTLEKDRDARFSSMSELKEALESIQTTTVAPNAVPQTSGPSLKLTAIIATLLFLFVSVGYVVSSYVLPSRADAERLNQAAWRALRTERYGEAIDYAQQSTARDPSYAAALDTLAVCQFLRTDDEDALKTIDQALSLAKKENQRDTISSCYFHKGVIYKSLNRYSAGIKCFDQSVGYNPERWELTKFKDQIGKYRLDSRESKRAKAAARSKPPKPPKSNITWDGPMAEVKAGDDNDLQILGQNLSTKQLALYDGHFTESGTDNLRTLKLEKLVILSTKVPGTFFQDLNLSNLKVLEIADHVDFDPAMLNEIEFPNLERLKIDGCSFPDEACRALLQLKKLRSLEIVRCPEFTGKGWETLKNLPLNTVGWIPPVTPPRAGGVIDAGSDSFETPTLKNLKAVNPSHSYPSHEFQNFLSSAAIKTIVLDSDYLDPKDCEQLSSIKSVTTLDLSGKVPLAAHHMRLLASLPKLETLSLRGPIIRSFDTLSVCRNLKHLSFTNAEVNPQEVERLSKLKLESLYISQMAIHKECFPHLYAMQGLKQLTFGAGLNPQCPSLDTIRQKLPNCLVQSKSEEY